MFNRNGWLQTSKNSQHSYLSRNEGSFCTSFPPYLCVCFTFLVLKMRFGGKLCAKCFKNCLSQCGPTSQLQHCHYRSLVQYYNTINTELKQRCRRREQERQKSNSLRLAKQQLHHAFLSTSLPSLHDYNVEVPNFTVCRGREHNKTTFLFFSWTFETVCRIHL